MIRKLLFIVSLIWGIKYIIAGISYSSTDLFLGIAIICLGLMIFPYTNNIIHKLPNPYSKIITITVGLLFFGSWIIYTVTAYNSQNSPEAKADQIKRSNIDIAIQLARDYCKEIGSCANSLNDVYRTGKTGPFESYNPNDYSYQQIDNGKDCVITTYLSKEKHYSRLCVGENLEYVKYLKGSEK